MILDIANGISIKLNELFGDDYTIYTEDVRQGLEEPCFFIKTLPVTTRKLLGARKERRYHYDIAHFTEGGNEEMMHTGEQMLDGLEHITLTDGSVLHVSSIDMNIVDGVLHVSVIYPVILTARSAAEDAMSTYSANIGTKGD